MPKPDTRTKRPRDWRRRTGAPVGRPGRIFDTVMVPRVDRTVDPPREHLEEMRIPDRICELLRGGVPASGATESVGLDVSTYHNWRATGVIDKRAGNHSIYVEFLDASTRAIGESMVGLVAMQRKHAQTDPRANEFMLRNRFPKEFGERHRLEVVAAEDAVPDDLVEAAILEAARSLGTERVLDVPGVSAQERRALVADTKRAQHGNGKKNGRNGSP